MYRIVVVDDKKAIREGLTKHLPWKELGYELVGAAAGAQEAIQLIETNCIDVLLTDIVMPDMTGLELIYFAKLINPDIKVIILSAYDRFDYAQKAIGLGAHCYLTKPVDLEELQTELLAIEQILLKDTAARRQNTLFLEIAREQFFSQLLNHEWKEDAQIRKQATTLQLTVPTGQFVVLCAEAFPSIHSATAIREQLELAAQRLGEALCIEKRETACSLLLFSKSSELEGALTTLCDSLRSETLSIGVSNSYFDLSVIPAAYQEAQKALEYRIMKTPHAVFFYHRIKPLFQTSGELSLPQKEELLQHLAEENLAAFQQCVGQLLSERTAKAAPEAPYDIYLTLIFITNHYMEQTLGVTEQISDETQQLIRDMLALTSPDESKRKLMHYIERCFSRLQSDSRKVSNQIVERAMEYIREHYNEEITLKKLSRQVYVNPMYLSRLFKEKAGISYIDYLTEVRMTNAKQLLQNLSLRIYDISEMVGYESRKHFGKIFKEHTGQSPKEYRNALSG